MFRNKQLAYMGYCYNFRYLKSQELQFLFMWEEQSLNLCNMRSIDEFILPFLEFNIEITLTSKVNIFDLMTEDNSVVRGVL